MPVARVWVVAIGLSIGWPACPGDATAADDGPPNIVLMMTDDQGYGDLGIQGNPVIETPNIDAMGRRSASMRSFYVSPVCTPTRACLMTGRYNYRTRAIDTFVGRAMMEPDEVTIAELLRDAGYATGIFGKWHLGDCYPMRAIDQGFTEALVHRGGGLAQPADPPENERRYSNPILFRNGEQVSTVGYCTDLYFDAALSFIENCHAENQPFFVYLPTNAPHGPFHDVPSDLYEKYRAKDLAPVLNGNAKTADRVARIFAMIENVDQNVGRLFSKLDDLRLDENTIVVFMVDNGPNTARYVGDMRGSKGGVHEGSIRSPLFVQWEGRLRAGTQSDRIAAHIDIMPTLLDAAGIQVPNEVQLDGRSLLPLLEGRDVNWPDRYIALQWHRGDRPVRYHHFAIRDQRYKLLRASPSQQETLDPSVPFELYDLVEDPREQQNLMGEEPEIFARLKHAYEQWFDDVSSTRPNNYERPRIVIGSRKQTQTALTKQDWHRSQGRGWGTHGSWSLEIAESGPFEVTAIMEQPVSGQAVLRIGDKLWTAQASEEREIVFVDVAPDTGSAELEFQVHDSEAIIGPYQVIVERS